MKNLCFCPAFWKSKLLKLRNTYAQKVPFFLNIKIHFDTISLDTLSHIWLHFDCSILVNHMYCVLNLCYKILKFYLSMSSSMRTLPKFLPTPNFRRLCLKKCCENSPKQSFSQRYAHPKTGFGWFWATSLNIDLPTFFHLCLKKCLKNLPRQTFSRR